MPNSARLQKLLLLKYVILLSLPSMLWSILAALKALLISYSSRISTLKGYLSSWLDTVWSNCNSRKSNVVSCMRLSLMKNLCFDVIPSHDLLRKHTCIEIHFQEQNLTLSICARVAVIIQYTSLDEFKVGTSENAKRRGNQIE